MRTRFAPVRLLPATIVAMAVLLGVKSVSLVRAAEGADAAPVPAAPAAMPVAKPAAAPAPLAPPTPPEGPSASERALLLDLRARRETLDRRAGEIEARSAVLDAEQRKLGERVAELAALQTRLEAEEAARRARQEADWQGIVRTYEAMKPRDAAVIFDDLDSSVLLPVLDRMKAQRAAPVLAAMQPERARIATQALAELRLRESRAPGGAR